MILMGLSGQLELVWALAEIAYAQDRVASKTNKPLRFSK